jgi:hypothetical protein
MIILLKSTGRKLVIPLKSDTDSLFLMGERCCGNSTQHSSLTDISGPQTEFPSVT